VEKQVYGVLRPLLAIRRLIGWVGGVLRSGGAGADLARAERRPDENQPGVDWHAAMDSLAHGVLIYNDEREIVFCNKRYREIYQATSAQTKPGTPIAAMTAHSIALGLKIPSTPAEFINERANAPIIESNTIDEFTSGLMIARSVRPLPGGGGIVTYTDITGREALHSRLREQNEVMSQQQEELRLRNEQFDIALNHMPQGLCFFDKDQRLLVCNERYVEMYNIDPANIYPGIPLSEVIGLRYAAGSGPKMTRQDYQDNCDDVAATQKPSDRLIELQNGRIFIIRHHPLPDNGWVATHEDATERQTLYAQLQQQYEIVKEQQETLRQRNLQFDLAINNMGQGLCFYDKDERLIVCNQRYIEMYGLDPKEVYSGITLREIVNLRHRAGTGPSKSADEDYAYLTTVAFAHQASDSIVERADGRVIDIHHRPMADGGYVATHDDITEQRRSEAKIAYMAQHDALTDLANRVLLNERLENALARAKRGEVMALHLIDLDYFKRINDTLGHPMGDLLLKEVAQRLRFVIREGDTLARLGGDEFALLQVRIQHADDAAVMAQRIIDLVSTPYDLDGNEAVIGATVGVAIGGVDAWAQDELVRKADLALYAAKGMGRGRFQFFLNSMDADMQSRRALERDLRRALRKDEFELRFETMVRVHDGGVSGFEAEIFWQHPEQGVLAPETFLPLAEELGLTAKLADWALREACLVAAKWPPHVQASVNLCAEQLRNAGLPLTVVSALAASGLPASRLELEVPESALLSLGDAVLPVLNGLRELGVLLVLDDFGVSGSLLRYLRDLPFHKVKLSSDLVKDAGRRKGSAELIRTIATLASGAGIVCAAKGVDTAEQREKVAAEGCIELQGELFGQPRRAVEIQPVHPPQSDAVGA
jgi:diguanylate cyclase (GGDEF)-like protein